MAFSRAGERDQAIAEINIIPLCDVLLVLLIIFMVTAPAVSQTIGLDLPRPSPDVPVAPLEPVDLRIDGAGQVSWDGAALRWQDMVQRMQAMGGVAVDEQPVLRVSVNTDAEYQVVAKVLAAANNAGLVKVGLVGE